MRYFVDHPRFAQVGGLLVNPEAGVNDYMIRDEKRSVLEIALEEVGGKMPVFAWTTPETILVAQEAKKANAGGVVLAPPAVASISPIPGTRSNIPSTGSTRSRRRTKLSICPSFAIPSSPSQSGLGLGSRWNRRSKFAAKYRTWSVGR